VHFIDEKFTVIKARNVAIVFLGLDALATAIQGGGTPVPKEEDPELHGGES
jgi:hypothetical protein